MGLDGARRDELRDAAAHISAAELDAARYDFHRTHPKRSARRTFHITQFVAIALIIAGFSYAALTAPNVTWTIVHAAAVTLFSLAILLRLAAAAHLKPILSRLADPPRWPVYTILCPIYREANVVPDLVASLDAIDYPAME